MGIVVCLSTQLQALVPGIDFAPLRAHLRSNVLAQIPRSTMYKVGSLFYGIYFLVSFPVFYRMDEGHLPWSMASVLGSSLGACMLVTLLLDFWRLAFGPLSEHKSHGLPWLQKQ